MLKYYFLTGIIMCNIVFAKEINESDTTETKVNSYEVGYADGKKQGIKEIPVNCLGGCFAGVGGGCLGTMVIGWNDSDANTLVAASIAGSVVTGSLFPYITGKSKNVPNNVLTSDSLYNVGFIDGYRKATRKKRAINTICGWVVGTGLSVGMICGLTGILGTVPME